MLHVRATTGLSSRSFALTDLVQIATVEGVLAVLVMFGGASLWRFPFPFSISLLFGLLLLTLVISHVVVLRGRWWKNDSKIRGPIVAFRSAFAVQGLQLMVYPALSSAFAASRESGQLALVFLFPLVKYGFRASLRWLTRQFPNGSNESAVGGVEIAAAMYQSMLMQTTASASATALLLAIDMGTNVIGVVLLMATPSSVPSQEITCQATELLRAHQSGATTSETSGATVVPTARVLPLARSVLIASGKWLPPGLDDALPLLHTAESLVLIEYFEVALPSINAIFIAIASQLSSSDYSPKLRIYRHRPHALVDALGILALNTMLQAMSLVVVHALIWWQYQVSTTTLLAFVLERHVWATQGKLVAWLALIFQLPVLHYGFDFTFQFKPALPPLA